MGFDFAAHQRKWRANNRERALATQRKSSAAMRERSRALLISAKDVPCADCGVKYPPIVMDFDHVRGTKSFNIGSGAGTRSLARIQQEIDKCDVVCSNCHRLRTLSRSLDGQVV